MAVAQRLLPLRCVICRAKILRLKHSNAPPLSGGAYNNNWYHVPQSASLYSVTSNTSAVSGKYNTVTVTTHGIVKTLCRHRLYFVFLPWHIPTGVSSASSCSSASSYKTCASSFSIKKAHYSAYAKKMGYEPLNSCSPVPSCRAGSLALSRSTSATMSSKKQNGSGVLPSSGNPGKGPSSAVPSVTSPPKGKLKLVQDFQREFRIGKERIGQPSNNNNNHHKIQNSMQKSGSAGSSLGGSTRIK